MLRIFKRRKKEETEESKQSAAFLERILLNSVAQVFMQLGVEEFRMSIKEIHCEFFGYHYDIEKIRVVIAEKLKLLPDEKQSYTTPKYELAEGRKHVTISLVPSKGKPYVFKMEQFLTAKEQAQLLLRLQK